MNEADAEALHAKLARLEGEVAALKADTAVHRGALVWLMGVHQLGPDDHNPKLAVLGPLDLDLNFNRTRPYAATPAELRAAAAARNFVEAAHRVFLSRQPPQAS